MTAVLSTAQITLGTAFALAGTFKAFRYDQARAKMPWVASVPKGLVTFIGLAELLGGLGLILPWATGIAPFVTPAAGAGLALTMLFAAGFHANRRELTAIPVNAVLGALAAFVTYGRWVVPG